MDNPSGVTINIEQAMKDLSLLAPRPRQKPLVTQQGLLDPQAPDMETANDNSLDDVASLISKKDNVPADWLIYNVINPMAWHESATTMDPTTVQRNDGPGRGMLQFEGRRGYKKMIKVGSKTDVDEDGQDLTKTKLGQDSFDTAIKRAKNFYTQVAKKDIPAWIKNVKKGEDARSLTSNQQRALGLLNIRMQNTSDFKKLHKNFTPDTLTNFWKKHHHKGSSKETKKVSEKRKESFKSLLKSFQKSAYSSGSLGFAPPPMAPRPRPRPQRTGG